MTSTTQNPVSLRRHRLRVGAFFAGLVVLLAACSSNSTTNADGTATGIQDGFTHGFETFEGGETTVAALAGGKPVVLNFFASTCAPCITELPEFEGVHKAVQDDIHFVGLASDGDRPENAARLIEATGITFDVGLDTPDSQFLVHYNGLGMPTTVFIRADGTVAERWTGILDADALNDKIDEFLR